MEDGAREAWTMKGERVGQRREDGSPTRLELLIGAVLRVGVATSSVCMAAGLVLALIGVAPWVANLFLQVGLVALLCTPVLRVLVSTIEYIAERDWMFASLTLTVLGELMASAAAALLFNERF